MGTVLSLIAARSKTQLTQNAVDRARRALGATGAEVGSPEWLSEGEAADLPYAGERKLALTTAREAFADEPIDINVVAIEVRRKKLLLADMDSTMIGQEC